MNRNGFLLVLATVFLAGCGTFSPSTLQTESVQAAAASGQGTYYYRYTAPDGTECEIAVSSGRDPVGIDAKVKAKCQLEVETKLTPEQQIKLKRLEVVNNLLDRLGPYVERLIPLLQAVPGVP